VGLGGRIQVRTANVSFTFSRTALFRLGFKYLIVDSMSVCPIQSCTVRSQHPSTDAKWRTSREICNGSGIFPLYVVCDEYTHYPAEPFSVGQVGD